MKSIVDKAEDELKQIDFFENIFYIVVVFIVLLLVVIWKSYFY